MRARIGGTIADFGNHPNINSLSPHPKFEAIALTTCVFTSSKNVFYSHLKNLNSQFY
ncbi:hypothetical protein [Phormidium nigroviride]